MKREGFLKGVHQSVVQVQQDPVSPYYMEMVIQEIGLHMLDTAVLVGLTNLFTLKRDLSEDKAAVKFIVKQSLKGNKTEIGFDVAGCLGCTVMWRAGSEAGLMFKFDL